MLKFTGLRFPWLCVQPEVKQAAVAEGWSLELSTIYCRAVMGSSERNKFNSLF